MTALANTVKSDPAVDAVMAFNGGGFGRALNTGNMFITLGVSCRASRSSQRSSS